MTLRFISLEMSMVFLAGGTMGSICHGIDQSDFFKFIFVEEFVWAILRDG